MCRVVDLTDPRSLHLVAVKDLHEVLELLVGKTGIVNVVGDAVFLERLLGILARHLDEVTHSRHFVIDILVRGRRVVP